VTHLGKAIEDDVLGALDLVSPEEVESLGEEHEVSPSRGEEASASRHLIAGSVPMIESGGERRGQAIGVRRPIEEMKKGRRRKRQSYSQQRQNEGSSGSSFMKFLTRT
jgi:hypothetical protein